jgi:SPP1 family predicted phage head-tail adaptor
MVSLGNLSDRITLQAEVRSADASGGASVTWSDIATVFAQVTPRSAGEKFAAGQNIGQASYRFTIRTPPPPPTGFSATTAARLIWMGVAYNITAVMLNPTPRYTDIIATAGVAT